MACDEKRLAVCLFRSSPIILHFDEQELPKITIVQVLENSTVKSGVVSPYHMYDIIAKYTQSHLENFQQFIVSHTPTSRIYMVACIQNIQARNSQANNLATQLLHGINMTENHYNVLWPVCHKHTLPNQKLLAQSPDGLKQYGVRGPAFFFKESRQEESKPWVLCDFTKEQFHDQFSCNK